jgi:hypothetical protein
MHLRKIAHAPIEIDSVAISRPAFSNLGASYRGMLERLSLLTRTGTPILVGMSELACLQQLMLKFLSRL